MSDNPEVPARNPVATPDAAPAGVAAPAGMPPTPAHWPGPAAAATAVPAREALAQRAAQTQSPRDLAEYLRLRRKKA